MPRYFKSENANRPILAGGRKFSFEVVDISAGTATGVITVPDADAELFLSVAERFGVEEISAEEHEAELKKKAPTPRWADSGNRATTRLDAPPLKGAGAVVIEGAEAKAGGKKLGFVEAASSIQLGAAASPDMNTANQTKENRRANHRTKRGTDE